MDRIEKLLRWLVCGLAAAVIVDVVHAQLAGFRIHAFNWIVVAMLLGLVVLSAQRRIPAKASLALLSTVGCWIATELALGWLTHDDQRPFAWYVWPPGYRCEVIPSNMPGIDQPGVFSTNSRGLRAPEFSADDDYRILCVGGSTTECLYQDDRRTWVRQLAAQLDTRNYKVWVGNAGRSGLIAADHVTLLTHSPEARQVDCWVVLCGVNDMGQQLNGTYDEAIERTWRHTFAYRRPGLGGQWDRPLYNNTCSIAFVRQLWSAVHDGWFSAGHIVQDNHGAWYVKRRRMREEADKVDGLPDLTAMLDEYEHQLRSMIVLSRERGKRLIFFTQPSMWSPDITPENEALCWSGALTDGTYRSSAALSQAMGAYNQRMKDVCQDEHIEIVDLAAQLAKSTATHYDDCHFNDAGSARVAELASKTIRPLAVTRRMSRRDFKEKTSTRTSGE